MSPAPSPQNEQKPFFDKDMLSFLALIAFPILALVSAVFGLILVVQGHILGGLLFLLVLTQAFAIGGLVVWTRRRRPRD